MNFEDLTSEQQIKARTCKSTEELLALAREEGYELTDAELESVAGGGIWDCNDYFCSAYGEGLDEDPGWN